MKIRRDRWGVPHIEAGGHADLFFAQGFCHGQDRLWQIDFYRRVVRGRVSEMAGPEGLPIDRLMLTLGIRRVAEREVAALDAEVLRRLETFCAGVNAAADEARALPFEMQLLRLEFEPWRPVDVLSIGKLLAFGLSTNWEKELLRSDMARALGPELAARLDPGYPADNPVASQEAWSGEGLALAEQIDAVRRSIGMAVEASGSNNWAVTGALSATGSPLIAGDPHLPPSMPGIWYQVGLHRPDGRFLRGASLPGMPGVYMGQSNDVCWTFTNSMADIEDLFIEKVDGDRYLFEDEWRPLEILTEEIPVKGREPERPRGARHPPRPDRQRGARRRRRRAARPALADPRRVRLLRRHVRPRRGRLGPGAGAPARGPQLAGLEPDLGRPPRLDRLQDDRPPADPQGRLPRPAEAGLDRRVRVGGRRPLRGNARDRSTPRAASWSPPTTASSATSGPTT